MAMSRDEVVDAFTETPPPSEEIVRKMRDDHFVANVSTSTPRGKANALLVAAAPDMLAALQGVVRVADRATVEFDAARAAIAKATSVPVI